MLGLILLLWIAVQLPVVQNWIIKKVTASLSERLHTKVSISHIDLSLFNKMELQGLLIEDHKKDTLVFAGQADVRITDWFFLKNKVTLKYIRLQHAIVNMNRTDSVWNYEFLADYFSGPKRDSTKQKGIQLDLKYLELDNVAINIRDKWLRNDKQYLLGKFVLKADNFDPDKKKITISSIELHEAGYTEYSYQLLANPPPPSGPRPFREPSTLQWNSAGWDISVKEIALDNSALSVDRKTLGREIFAGKFDGDHLQFTGINGALTDLHFYQDTITTNLKLAARERSGLEVKNLVAKLKLTPERMEFNDLLLETNRSRIENYFAMHFTDFSGDFARFVQNVTLEGNFDKTIINSNDLAYFDPTIRTWNRLFNLKGHAKGTVENLVASGMQIRSGNSSFAGNFSLRGLPDINSTFIDVKSDDLLTNYSDLTVLAPALRNISNPRLSKLGNIRFRGNFTGFINDFVAYGNISTSLGNVRADINLKLPPDKDPSYSGKISSTGFQLGLFLEQSKLGSISMEGNVKGRGFNLKNLTANFDGTVHQIEFSGYSYRNINIKGLFEKKLFSGHLAIDDPNLKLESLDGTINLAKETTVFNFDAVLTAVNLKAIKLTNQDFSLKGHFNFDFTGNNIDNFIGTAKVFDATLRHDSTRLSFDSLSIASFLEDSNKVFTVQSNEVEATLRGQYRLLELPDAFRVFLSRYYPTYIQKPNNQLHDQDFSFLIRTRQVDDYVRLLNNQLSGFDNAEFSGNLKLAKNELNVNATIPQFAYGKKVFNDINLTSEGNLDSLTATLKAGDIVIDDSLHFPGSTIRIGSQNDISVIQVKTSAEKTLSQAELNARVQTMPDSIVVNFAPSSFFINDKKWNLEKGGRLTLSNSFVEARDMKFDQGPQEITIFTTADKNNGTTSIVAGLKKVNINDFNAFVLQQMRLEGVLTGTLILKDPFGKISAGFEGEADDFRFENKTVGDVKLNGDLNTTTGLIQFNALAKGKENDFSLKGHYNYKDSSEHQLEADFMSEHFNLNLLEAYLGSVFSNFNGDAISTLKLKGGEHKTITGQVRINDGSFIMNYTRCKYKFTNQVITFIPDGIDLGNILLKDTLNNSGRAGGILHHNLFNDFSFENVTFETKKMLVLNTTKKDNGDFYGKVIGNAKLSLDGPLSNMAMEIEGGPSYDERDGSHIYLPTGSSKEAGQIDYIEFIQFGNKMEEGLNTKEGTNISLNMNLTANPACKIDVILDEELGDVIKGRGNGLLNIRAGSKEPLSIRGRYDITDGEYTFNFQTFLKKYFTIRHGSIVWTGDPYLAKITIDAEYLAKNVDVSSLASSVGFKQKESVTIISRLTGSLQKPDISFEFVLPPESDISKDYVTRKKLDDFKNDPNEMNKQVASLLLFNSFISSNQNFLSGGNTYSLAANTIGGIVSNLLTNLFNKQLEKATNGILSTYFDINSSLDLENKAALLQASLKAGLKILLSNKLVVLIGGNLDYNNPYAQLAKKGLFTPDITIEWLLNKDGSLRVVGFNRTSVDLTVGQRNRSGVSLSFRKDVNRLIDLFKSRKRLKKEQATNNLPVASQGTKVEIFPVKKN